MVEEKPWAFPVVEESHVAVARELQQAQARVKQLVWVLRQLQEFGLGPLCFRDNQGRAGRGG